MTRVASDAGRAALAGACLLIGAGCAAPGVSDAPFALTEDYASGNVSYAVQRGDSLATIALEFTGDVDRWRAIAAHNGIDDPKRLRAGAVIEIPGELIPRDSAPEPSEPTVATVEETDAMEPVDAGASGRAAVADQVGTSLPERAAPVVVSAVETNRRFDLAPLDDDATDQAANRFVKVVGTYYPIAVYAEPAPAARLVMRVTPGTLLPLERELGDWYLVETDRGTGYLRVSDGSVSAARN